MILNFENLINKYNLKINGIIHIGAHFGNEHQTYKQHNIKNIVYFEPVKKTFEKLKSNIKDDSVLFNIALGSENKKIKMFIETSNNGQSSSVLEPDVHLSQYPWITFKDFEEVDMMRLDDMALEEKYNFINIDVQGYELEVFKGAEKTLNKIDYIMAEVNRAMLYKNCAQIDELDNFLLKFGFRRVETDWQGNTWGDAFYIKEKYIKESDIKENNFVTCRTIGSNGRFGNQLFQAATAFAIAKDNNLNLKLSWRDGDKYFKEKFNDQVDYSKINFEYKESHKNLNYTKIIIPKNQNIDICGYFQSEKYFYKYKEEIRKMFTPKDFILDKIKDKYNSLLKTNVCSVHVRRGDYIGNFKHEICDMDYYRTTINKIKEKSEIENFIFISDDIIWCKSNFSEKNYYFATDNSPIEDLFLMSFCNHNILSNSSFSWWGSWLNNNPNKIVISPDKWFSAASGFFNNDIFTEYMIKVPTKR